MKFSRRTFIDSLRVYVRGGSGGMGLPKIGGVGGNGGNVYFVGHSEASLARLKQINPTKRFTAGAGGNSKAVQVLGSPGTNLEVRVPVGIDVINEFGRIVATINRDGDRVLVAAGGVGGNSLNQFCGQKGRGHIYTLDLKLIADVGLVGFPNAGKSTLLQAVSAAKPKIASYPFTTLQPQLGVVKFEDFREFSVADLPGLIEGASTGNRGLGHKFLKHVERTKLLLFVVDVFGFQLGPKYPYRSPFETILLLNKELEAHRDELVDRPAILVCNKLDRPGGVDHYHRFKALVDDLEAAANDFWADLDSPDMFRPEKLVKFRDIVPISAAADPASIEQLKWRVRAVLDEPGDAELSSKTDQLIVESGERMREFQPSVL